MTHSERPARGSAGIMVLTPDRRTGTARVLANAFHDDPLFSALWPRPGHRARTLRTLFAALAKTSAEAGSSYVAVDLSVGEVRGAALWLEPGAKRTLRQTLREVRSVWPTLLWPRTLVPGARLLLAIDRLRPREPHWYLESLGVDPAAQGTGVGAGLLETGLGSADAAGLPVYLETSREENLAWYHRFGFEVGERVQAAGSDLVAWTMLRQPVNAA